MSYFYLFLIKFYFSKKPVHGIIVMRTGFLLLKKQMALHGVKNIAGVKV